MIVGIVGQMGSGKTLSMVFFAYHYQKQGKKILSNFRVRFPHRIITKKDIIEYGKGCSKELEDTLICLDEVQIMLDSRLHAKKGNRLISYMLLQSRKRSVDWFYTTQQFHNVEKRLRENTDLIIECSPTYTKEAGKKKVLQSVRLSFINYHGRDVFSPIQAIDLIPNKDLYELYDTYQIIDYSGDDDD